MFGCDLEHAKSSSVFKHRPHLGYCFCGREYESKIEASSQVRQQAEKHAKERAAQRQYDIVLQAGIAICHLAAIILLFGLLN